MKYSIVCKVHLLDSRAALKRFEGFRYLAIINCIALFVHEAFSSPLLIIPLDRFLEMKPSGQKVATF